MPGLIPENILEDILSRINIVDLIAEYIPLKRAGRNFRTLCPFHHEKTPSFMVSPDRQIFHCFGCGESGNAFKFLMRHERLEFPEAVEILARKAGISLPEVPKENSYSVNLSLQLYKINESTASFYERVLNSPEGAAAKKYLLSRNLSEETIKSFHLGFAPDKWDGLINFLREKNFSLGLMEKAGLVLPKDNGGYYDRFRNRVIFPIRDAKSRYLAFGGRILSDNKQQAKYMNSPETPIYIKGRHLYGLDLAKETIREKDFVVVVEGYLDFIMPYQHGLKNIVASLGTALTEDQVRLLKRFTQNVVMVYDADNAGQMATLRTLDLFIEEGMEVKIVSLPEGLDPDSFVRKNGIEGFLMRIKLAANLFDYKLSNLKGRHNIKEIEGKARVSSEMLSTINRFKNAVSKSEYVKRLAEELSVREEPLWEELGKFKLKQPRAEVKQLNKKAQVAVNPTEKLLIKLMLAEDELARRIRQELEPADFQDERISRLVSLIFNFIEQGKAIEPHKLANFLDDQESLQFICESAFESEVSEENKEKVVTDCIKVIKNKRVFLRRQYLQEEIRIAERLGDEDRLNTLRDEFCNLIKTPRA
ncbi:MAG: DNA primase [Candidatus Omnitrophica bacterium]|nr:DNA primase [Candidatus Omnitrophota bacterium]